MRRARIRVFPRLATSASGSLKVGGCWELLSADPRQRTVAVSVWITSFAVGGAVGPLVGGVLLEWFWWGSVFLVAVPVMALLLVLGPLLLVLGPRLLPEFRDPAAGRLDLGSAALSLVAVLAAIYGLKQLAQDGPGWLAVGCMLVGLLVGVGFVRRQRRLADPTRRATGRCARTRRAQARWGRACVRGGVRVQTATRHATRSTP
jgi:MFS family permease